MRVLVTGATGFVGRRVCTELASGSHAVRPVSRSPQPGFMALGQLTGTTDWRTALTGCDAVVHLAARVHRLREAGDQAAAYRADNVAVTLNLARQAADAGVRRFVFMSSIKVQGETTTRGRPFTEADVPHPADAYGRSKLEAEQGLQQLAVETGLEVVTIRPPLVYGAGVRANFRTMLRLAESGWPLPLGAVDNRRSLLALGNLASLVERCVADPRAANRTFLASDGEDLSTAELLRRLARLMGRPARLIAVPPALLEIGLRAVGRGDVARRVLGDLQVDNSGTRRVLDWTPPLTVDAGLAEAVADYRAGR